MVNTYSLSPSMKEDQDQDLSTTPYDASSLSCPNLQSYQQERVAIPREQNSLDNNDCMIPIYNLLLLLVLLQPCADDHRLSIFNANRTQTTGEDWIGPADQAQPSRRRECSNGNNSPPAPTAAGGIVRVCSNCSTTKTPLWRSGPQGPKSLCNACGIRQMKARRRAMRAAAAAASAVGAAPEKAAAKKKERSEVDRSTVPFKKRFKIATPSSAPPKKLPFDDNDDVKIALSRKVAFYQAFPQEEKDAAILLMALSCGLIHG